MTLKQHILMILKAELILNRYNYAKTARKLAIARRTLYNYLGTKENILEKRGDL